VTDHWVPARPGDTPAAMPHGDDGAPLPRPRCSLGGGFRLTTLALGRRRVYHLRNEWPHPTHRRRRPRRPPRLHRWDGHA